MYYLHSCWGDGPGASTIDRVPVPAQLKVDNRPNARIASSVGMGRLNCDRHLLFMLIRICLKLAACLPHCCSVWCPGNLVWMCEGAAEVSNRSSAPASTQERFEINLTSWGTWFCLKLLVTISWGLVTANWHIGFQTQKSARIQKLFLDFPAKSFVLMFGQMHNMKIFYWFCWSLFSGFIDHLSVDPL